MVNVKYLLKGKNIMNNNNIELDFTINTLGSATIHSPITLSMELDDFLANYVPDDKRIIYNIDTCSKEQSLKLKPKQLMECAGPRENIYFDPAKVKAAIVTCGGLCPGLNDVIRSIVMCLWYQYGVRRISGIRFGYRGFLPEFNFSCLDLNPESVQGIHQHGGTLLGSSRGYGERTSDIVDALERINCSMLFTIGGDGTQKGAYKLYEEIKKRGLKIAIIGIPKTIDNDLSFVQKSFGFETAVESAVQAVTGAHVEAHDGINGISIVKVMGRESGFIAAHTTLATNDVNFVLVPEVPFDLEGSNGLLFHLQQRLAQRNHALILVAEGAGQDLLTHESEADASGNPKLADIGVFLKSKISTYFKEKEIDINLKYIDPSYIIRSQPANSNDSIYCARLGTNAVHAAMAGKTGLIISLIHDRFVHVPIKMAILKKNRIDPDESLWRDVVEATGQPGLMKN